MHYEHSSFIYNLKKNETPNVIPIFHRGSLPLEHFTIGASIVDVSGTVVSSINYNNDECVISTPDSCFCIEPMYGNTEDNIFFSYCIKENDKYTFFLFSQKQCQFQVNDDNWMVYPILHFGMDFSNFTTEKNPLGEIISSKTLCENIPLFSQIPETSDILYFLRQKK